MREVRTGQIYRHFKGNLYQIVVVATHSETNERYVVYQALYNNPEKRIKYGDIFVRRYTEFISEVDRKKYPLDKYPQYTQQYRFEPVEEDE